MLWGGGDLLGNKALLREVTGAQACKGLIPCDRKRSREAVRGLDPVSLYFSVVVLLSVKWA